MDLEYITSHLKQNASFGLPIICFSISENNIFVTTKKVGSRFFEYYSEDTKYIEFKVKEKSSCLTEEIENGIEFYDFIFLYFENNSTITYSDFLNILKIDNIIDIFQRKLSNNWKLNIIIRNPIIRLLSGYVELVDSLLIDFEKITDKRVYQIIKKYADLNNQFSIKNFSKEESGQILNYFSNDIISHILNDEHTSNWNSFIFYILQKNTSKLNIVDLDNPIQMQEFGNDSTSISNKGVYSNWIKDNLNQPFIVDLFENLGYFFISEYNNYIRITSKK